MEKYKQYRDYIDTCINNNILVHNNKFFNTVLTDSLSDGKRLRPIIVIDIANSINKSKDLTKIGLSVEIIHNARY